MALFSLNLIFTLIFFSFHFISILLGDQPFFMDNKIITKNAYYHFAEEPSAYRGLLEIFSNDDVLLKKTS